MVQSSRFTLNKQDVSAWTKNALIFLAPALIVLIGSFQNLIPADASWGVVVLYALNVLVDILRKFIQGKA